MPGLRFTTSRLLGLSVATAVLAGGMVVAAQAATSTPPAQKIGDLFMCANNNTKALQLAWSTTSCPTGTLKFVVPQSHATGAATGPQGSTGATGPAGVPGPQGPSDLYPGTMASPLLVGDFASTFDTAAVPAGSYQVQFSASVGNSTVDQSIVCAVFPSSGPSLNLPVTRARIRAGALELTSISAVGWYTATAGTTFALKCAVGGTGQTATLGDLSMTATQAATIHLSLIHTPSPRDRQKSRMPSSA